MSWYLVQSHVATCRLHPQLHSFFQTETVTQMLGDFAQEPQAGIESDTLSACHWV